MVHSGDTNSAISVLRHLANVAEAALSTAKIKLIEVEDIRLRYIGKKAAKSDRRVFSKARVSSGKNVILLTNQCKMKDRLSAEKAVKNAVKNAAKNAKAQAKTNLQEQPSAVTPKKQVTIVVPSDHELSRSKHLFEDHPPVPAAHNTPSNPNPCLPDGPLGISWRNQQPK
ncbi:hypothetical protein BDD12DRAFT_885523 [Trichophaea hybrida]|nr:hypothetical protein BDD12DRAFT_885523 [Trichophaea hybrida]